MGDDNQTSSQQAQSNEPFFPVSKAVVFEGDARSRKYLVGILEAEAMLGDVLPILPLVPFVSHSRFVSTVTPFVVTHKGKSATLTRKSPRWSDLPLKHFPLIHSCPTLPRPGNRRGSCSSARVPVTPPNRASPDSGS